MQVDIDFKSLKKFYDKKDIRKFKDMKDSYKDIEGIKGNSIIYTVYRKKHGNFETGLNVLEPGTINKEFYITKGHKHKKPMNELYILIKGKGKLMI